MSAVDDATDLAATLAAGLAATSLALPANAHEVLLAYVGLLAKWNRTYNLTAIREPAKMVSHHLLDSLAVLPALDALVEGQREVSLLDVGSGAGLPGLPIAIARPAWRVVMLEPVHKKSAFIAQALAEFRITNAKARAVRVEDYRADAPFALAISRAFADLASFAQAAARHVAPDGHLVAMKGVRPDEELEALPEAFEVTAVQSIAVPQLDGARHLVVIKRR